MLGEARATDLHGLGETSSPSVLLGELGEGDRRRVGVDPASQILEAGRHGAGGAATVSFCVFCPVWPRSSVTVSVIW